MRDNLSDQLVKNPTRRKFSEKKKTPNKAFLDSEFTRPVKDVKGRKAKNWKQLAESGIDFDEYDED